MTNPQEPEVRRSRRGTTAQQGKEITEEKRDDRTGKPQGTDKGEKGGGEGGGVPPDQRSPHPG